MAIGEPGHEPVAEGLKGPAEFRFAGQQYSQARSQNGQNYPSGHSGLLVVKGKRSQLRQASSARSMASQWSFAKSKNSISRKRAVGTGVGVNRHVLGSLPSSSPAISKPIQACGEVPAISGSCGKMYGAQVPGTVMRTRPDWAFAVRSWPCLPGMGTLVAVGSH